MKKRILTDFIFTGCPRKVFDLSSDGWADPDDRIGKRRRFRAGRGSHSSRRKYNFWFDGQLQAGDPLPASRVPERSLHLRNRIQTPLPLRPLGQVHFGLLYTQVSLNLTWNIFNVKSKQADCENKSALLWILETSFWTEDYNTVSFVAATEIGTGICDTCIFLLLLICHLNIA